MKHALFSCYYKDGIEDFAKELERLGYKIISTGGTLKVLKEAGVDAIDVAEFTGSKDMLGGRVKTLHPKVHAGILYRREKPEDVKEIKELGTEPIDIVVNNLYPFKDTYLSGASDDEIIEKIDIGGPSMIRATAKNYKYTTIITDNEDFNVVLEEIKANGNTTLETRRELARKAFMLTAYYDAWIAKYFNEKADIDFPELLTLPLKKEHELRYGENPHQRGVAYELYNGDPSALGTAKQYQGKELSYNNYNDAAATVEMVKLFTERPTCVAVKHTNPCGIGEADTICEAYEKAYSCDDQSIFGGIVGFNKEVDAKTAEELVKIFLEVIIAPSYSKEALDILATKKNLRVLEIPDIVNRREKGFEMKVLAGTVIAQDFDSKEDNELELKSNRPATDNEIRDLKFAMKAVKFAKSNAVVIVKDGATVGIGLGSVNRFFAVEQALKQAGDKANGAVLASDAFFPFDDCVRLLAEHGVKAIVEPGGSLKDQLSIDAANELDVSLLFSGNRHFKH